MSSSQAVDAANRPIDRGRLDVKPRAVQRIAEQATADVTGWTGRGGGFGQALGRRLPVVDVTVTARHAVVTAEIAAPWGHGLADFAATLRDRVSARVGELTGLVVDRVDVRIIQVDHKPSPGRRVA